MYLIDTNIIIYYLNNLLSEKSKNEMTMIFKSCFNISVITKMELLGFREHSEESFINKKVFLSNSNIINIENNIVDKVVELKRRFSIKLPDAIIAASAILNNYTLITRNIDDFKKIEIKLYNPID